MAGKARARIIPVFIPHLGCPNDCAFCNQRAIASPHVPSPREVRDQVAQAVEALSSRGDTPPEVAFYGGSFTAIAPRLQAEYLDAVSGLIAAGHISGVRISTRPDCIDPPTLARLEAGHVRVIELGAQSMQDRVLSLSERGHTVADTLRAVSLIRGRFTLGLQMMVGLPGAGASDDLDTARSLTALEPDFVRIYPVCVLRGTRLAHMMDRGTYAPLDIEEAVSRCAPMLNLFAEKNIPVIRIGLNPSPELEAQVVGGPYHPALGELVRSRRLRQMACTLLDGLPPGKVTLTVSRGMTSLLRGQKNCNMLFFSQSYPHLQLSVCEADRASPPLTLDFGRDKQA